MSLYRCDANEKQLTEEELNKNIILLSKVIATKKSEELKKDLGVCSCTACAICMKNSDIFQEVDKLDEIAKKLIVHEIVYNSIKTKRDSGYPGEVRISFTGDCVCGRTYQTQGYPLTEDTKAIEKLKREIVPTYCEYHMQKYYIDEDGYFLLIQLLKDLGLLDSFLEWLAWNSKQEMPYDKYAKILMSPELFAQAVLDYLKEIINNNETISNRK